MESFKQYFTNEDESHSDFQLQKPELKRKQANDKVQELIDLVKYINDTVDKLQAGIVNTSFTPDQAEKLQSQISTLAHDLSGTPLPDEAHGIAGKAYTKIGSALKSQQINASYIPVLESIAKTLQQIV